MLDSIPEETEECLRDYWAKEVGRHSRGWLGRLQRLCWEMEVRIQKGLKEVQVVRLLPMRRRSRRTTTRPMTRWWGLGQLYSTVDQPMSEEREKLI